MDRTFSFAKLALYFFTLFMLLSAASFAAAPAVETFDNGDIDGWTANTTMTTVMGVPAGGNPGGFLSSQADSDQFGGVVGTLNGNEPWVGNFAAAGIGFFSVDLKFFQTLQNPRLRVRRSSGENGWHFVLIPTGNQSNNWQHFEINFDPTWSDQEAMDNGWVQESGTGSFSQVWSDVLRFEIRADDATENIEALGVDNVTIAISQAPSSVPTLSEWGLIAMAGVLGIVSFMVMRRRKVTA